VVAGRTATKLAAQRRETNGLLGKGQAALVIQAWHLLLRAEMREMHGQRACARTRRGAT
jgi:hypothetical protein